MDQRMGSLPPQVPTIDIILPPHLQQVFEHGERERLRIQNQLLAKIRAQTIQARIRDEMIKTYTASLREKNFLIHNYKLDIEMIKHDNQKHIWDKEQLSVQIRQLQQQNQSLRSELESSEVTIKTLMLDAVSLKE
jgi:multidrug efflux pump subunit AcrA (membrane-fusion protein)